MGLEERGAVPCRCALDTQYLIQIFQAKGYTWSTTIDRIDNEKEKDDLLEDFDSKGTDVEDAHTRMVEEADVYEMDGEDFQELINKQKGRGWPRSRT